jgi:hypothetical protein
MWMPPTELLPLGVYLQGLKKTTNIMAGLQHEVAIKEILNMGKF